MPVACFTRVERNGMHVLMPLAGRMKLDCMIVNGNVKWVFDRLCDGMPLPELVPAFPDKVITVRRSYLEKERDAVKKYLQTLAEAIYQVNRNREIGTNILRKRLSVKDPKVIEENLNIYSGIFSFPPRVGRPGLAGVLEQMQQQTVGAKSDFEVKRFLDESVVDELEREGFFKRFVVKETRK